MCLFSPSSLYLYHREMVSGQASRPVSNSGFGSAIEEEKARKQGRLCQMDRPIWAEGLHSLWALQFLRGFSVPNTTDWLGIGVLAWRTLEITEDTGHWPSKNSTLGPL